MPSSVWGGGLHLGKTFPLKLKSRKRSFERGESKFSVCLLEFRETQKTKAGLRDDNGH